LYQLLTRVVTLRTGFDLRVFAIVGLAVLADVCLASEIRKGATMTAKANSIWFQDTEKFSRWQTLKKGGDAKALAAYQGDVLRQRDAWQFTKPLTVKILDFAPKTGRADVEMTTVGRLQGSRWLLDRDALDAKTK
jgi:hypothetical protein